MPRRRVKRVPPEIALKEVEICLDSLWQRKDGFRDSPLLRRRVLRALGHIRSLQSLFPPPPYSLVTAFDPLEPLDHRDRYGKPRHWSKRNWRAGRRMRLQRTLDQYLQRDTPTG